MKEIVPKLLFLLSLVVVAYVYGYVSHRFQLFPAKPMAHVEDAVHDLVVKPKDELPFQYAATQRRKVAEIHRVDGMAPGLTLITRVGAEDRLLAEVLATDGSVVHQWSLDWFDIWPDATHLSERHLPKAPPGTHIHGAVIMEDGGLVFNYDQLGMVRVDVNGEVVWRLPSRTHHSIYRAESGNLWVPSMITREEPLDHVTYYRPHFEEYTILEVSPEDGKILREFSLFDILKQNELHGLLYLSSLDLHPESTGDTLHVNDFELFPEHMEPGFFEPGDAMVSMRNINAVLVFNLETGKKKFLSIGSFVRQHDPNFIDGDTISIFDNNDSAPAESGVQSRILLQNAPSGEVSVAYEGTPENPFFTDLLGKHTWLDNGNLLVVESRNGRVFEVNPDGELVWEYVNIVAEGVVGLVESAERLPERFTPEFFQERVSRTTDAGEDETADQHVSLDTSSEEQN